jgi:hypothetical protein
MMVDLVLADFLAERDDNHDVGVREGFLVDVSRAVNVEAEIERRLSERGWTERAAATGGAVGLCDHAKDRMSRVAQRAQGRNTKFTSAREDNAKGNHEVT